MTVVTAARRILVQLLQTLFGAEAVICLAHLDKLVRIDLVKLLALALNIRTVVAADNRALIIGKACDLQRGKNDVGGTFDQTLTVCIFNAQNKIAVIVYPTVSGLKLPLST